MSANTKVLNNAEAAALLGITPDTLKFWRYKGRGPKFIKLGEAKQAGVVYEEAEVLAWRDFPVVLHCLRRWEGDGTWGAWHRDRTWQMGSLR